MAKKLTAPAAAQAEPVASVPEQPQVEQSAVEQQPAEPVVLPEPAPETPAAPAVVKARVLVACAYGEPDDVIELDAELAKTLVDVVDPDPAAVAYAESLK